MKKRRVGLLLAWVAATATATLLASQAVALVRDQVTDRPSRVATTLALETTTSTTVAPTSTLQASAGSSTTTTTLPETTTSTLTETTTSSQPTSTTASPPTTTSTTITAPTNQEGTFYLTGGWVTVRCANNEAILVTYAPNPGFQVDIESAGTIELEIKFEEAGGEHESQLEVRCSAGVLEPKIDEHDDD